MSLLPTGTTILWFAPLLMLAAVAPVSAHAISAECQIRKDRVELEAYFNDDTPARHAKVVVTNSDQKAFAEGMTDDYGRWSFPTPGPGRYAVTVDAGDGHRVTVSLAVPETPGDTAASDGPSRDVFTRTPWLGAGLGLLVIALAAVGLRAAVRRKCERR